MVYFDEQTNFVCVSEALNKKYPKIFTEMISFIVNNNIKWKVLDSSNVWARDWMPLQVEDKFVKFVYKGYGDGYSAYPWLRVSRKCYQFLGKITYSNIVLDGGNCQRWKDLAFITDIVFKHNPTIEKKKLIAQLEKLLQAKVIFVPVEPGDDLGHTDGILTPVPGGPTDKCMLLINDYSSMKQKQFSKYQQRLEKILIQNDIDFAYMPYAYDECPWMTDKKFHEKFPLGDDYNPANGYYVNFLVVKNCVVLPFFGFKKDGNAYSTIEKHFPGYNIKIIDCSELAQEGGLTHCTTMNYKL